MYAIERKNSVLHIFLRKPWKGVILQDMLAVKDSKYQVTNELIMKTNPCQGDAPRRKRKLERTHQRGRVLSAFLSPDAIFSLLPGKTQST